MHDVTACGRSPMTRPTHKHSVMSLVLLLAIQNHLATELRDVSPYSFCHGTLVGFHTIAAGDKSFAPVSVSFTSVLTYDKWSDTAPCTLQAVPLSASKHSTIATHRSSALQPLHGLAKQVKQCPRKMWLDKAQAS